MRLGALPTPFNRLQEATSFPTKASSPFPPTVLDRSSLPFFPGLFENDIFPDCTAAALANSALAVSALQNIILPIEPASIPTFYASCVNCAPVPSAIAATEGAVILDVLEKQLISGFDVGEQVRLAALHGTIQQSKTAFALHLAKFGCLYIGVNLYDSDMDGGPWDLSRPSGSFIGGHALVLWDYLGLGDQETVRLATWGKLQTATWAWLFSRLTEAHGLFWRQLTPAMMKPEDADALARSLFS